MNNVINYLNPLEGVPTTVSEIMQDVLTTIFNEQDAFFAQLQKQYAENTMLLLKRIKGDDLTILDVYNALMDIEEVQSQVDDYINLYGEDIVTTYFKKEAFGRNKDKLHHVAMGICLQIEKYINGRFKMQDKVNIYYTKNKEDTGVLLGKRENEFVFTRYAETTTPPNSLIIGSPGTGKTYFFTKNQIINFTKQEHSMIIIGRTEELIEEITLFEKNDYKIIKLEIADLMSVNISDLVADLTERKTALILIQPTEIVGKPQNESLISFLSILFDNLNQTASGQTDKKHLMPLSIFFENFYDIEKITNIASFFETSYKKEISLHFSIQNVCQIQGLFQIGNPWARILRSCPIKIYFGANDIGTIEFFLSFTNNDLTKPDILYLSNEDMLVNIENNQTLHLRKVMFG